MFYNQAVRILRPTPGTSRSGEATLNYAGLAEAEGELWENVQVRPTSQTEAVGPDRETALSSWRIASRPGDPLPAVESTDWIRLPTGEVTRVVGEIARPADPLTGETHHAELTVREENG